MHRYRLYDLALEADFPLPELVLDPAPSGPPDVLVRLGDKRPPFEPVESGAAERAAQAAEPESWVVSEGPQSLLTHFADTARYRVRAGREVWVHPYADTDPDRVRHMLLGAVLAQVLWQRDLFALHGCVLSIAGQRCAFLGASGEGKSTLALALLQAGHTLFCDDVAALDWKAQPVRVRPAFPRLRAHADSLGQLGEARPGLAQAHRELPKWLVPARHFASQAEPLDRIYVLGTGETCSVERMARGPAMMELLRQTYYAQQFAGLYGVESHLARVAALAAAVPVYRLTRPKSWETLPSVVRFIEDVARAACT